jgi:hypothetical protein
MRGRSVLDYFAGCKPLGARVKRAITASLVALVVCGSLSVWQHAATARIHARAEQARLAALRMTPAKLQALEREAQIAAAAKAFAEQVEAARQTRENANHAVAPSSTPGTPAYRPHL